MVHTPAFPSLTPPVPAIAVPVQALDDAQLDERARAAREAGAQIIEWRIDAHREPHRDLDVAAAVEVLAQVGLPILATYRSEAEGGAGSLNDDGYRALLLALLENRVGALDIELSRPAPIATGIAAAAREVGVVVVGSSHDFSATPADLDDRFATLARRGSDVLKVAATPRSAGDVLRLMSAAERARVQTGRSVVPVSMGGAGALTRVAGALWRAPFTFAYVGERSAPGQLRVEQVRAGLDMLQERE